MTIWLKRLLKTFVALLIVGALAYYPLVVHSPSQGTPYTLDLAQIRALANSLPGDKPAEIRYEHIMDYEFAEAMVMAGEPWRGTRIPVYSYQLIFPDRVLMVDAGINREIAKPDFMVPFYDHAAYLRMSEALLKASQIILTHEHMDHIGGLAAHPALKDLLPKMRLTEEQFNNPAGMKPAVFPEGMLKDYQPLRYEHMATIAPGVVLIKSPGHTPGSQMVYIQRADGRELILLGDVGWQMRNIHAVRERPLFMTLMVGEDRDAVLGEFQALHDLMRSAPEVRLVPGHDGDVVNELTQQGLMQAGFKL